MLGQEKKITFVKNVRAASATKVRFSSAQQNWKKKYCKEAKGVFFSVFFKSPNSKINIPKNYPKLEI